MFGCMYRLSLARNRWRAPPWSVKLLLHLTLAGEQGKTLAHHERLAGEEHSIHTRSAQHGRIAADLPWRSTRSARVGW
ncbi:hypothetical protein BDA96_03G200000 [Sorghum bicolor]|uniref:Uncharacterized protein n=2 Tax=Sorghum bicolor TaxID=4558 RepID=A0A921REA1_SORBI|nr:hypothetical protein BDA96_03G200000 [Sorghum bicolor]OQU86988.1 hypothetical protein SORBI_3003G184633 [Sorghum bicolor]